MIERSVILICLEKTNTPTDFRIINRANCKVDFQFARLIGIISFIENWFTDNQYLQGVLLCFIKKPHNY
jgi:hypothetical protein